MLQLTHNWRVIAIIISLPALLFFGVSLYLNDTLYTHDWLPLARLLTFPITAGFLSLLLVNHVLWRYSPFRQILRIPDLNGRWEGWYFSTHSNQWHETVHEISQRALSIVPQCWGPNNWGRSITASMVTTPHLDSFELVWTYKIEITDRSFPGGNHSGVHFLRYSNDNGAKTLVGRYINDREHANGRAGVVGYIRLAWVGEQTKGSLSFTNESQWGMRKPAIPSVHPS